MAEMFRQIDAGKFSQIDVARHLNVAAARISEMRKGTRGLRAQELKPLAQFLGLTAKDPLEGTAPGGTYMIPNLGKVAQGVWLEQTTDEEPLPPVPYDRFLGDPAPNDLFAVTPEGTSMNLRFPPGSRLICRRVPFGSHEVASGQYVIVSRSAHDLTELTCKRLEIDETGTFWLHSESDDPRFKEPWLVGKPDNGNFTDMEVLIVGKVIRAVQVFD